MFHYLIFIIVCIIDLVVNWGVINDPTSSKSIIITVIIVTSLIVGIWLIALIFNIMIGLDNYKGYFNDIKVLKNKSTLLKDKIKEYKDEMKIILTESYKQFEENIMTSVKDSQLVATAMKENNYFEVLNTYNNTYKTMLDEYYRCEEQILLKRKYILDLQLCIMTKAASPFIHLFYKKQFISMEGE